MEVKELSIQEKIGQMLLLGIDSNYITEDIKVMIQVYKIGGFILYKKNFNSYSQMVNMIKAVIEMNKKVEKLGVDGVKKSAEIIGKILKQSGYNLNFAPVLDLKRFPDKHAIRR